jgi:putative membrane protein
MPADEPIVLMPPEDPRDRLAFDRTLLANERTFAAWLRTALAVAAVGLAAAHFLAPEVDPAIRFAIGAVFVAVGILIILLGAWRFAIVNRDLAPSGSLRTPMPAPLVFALAALIALLLVAILLIL